MANRRQSFYDLPFSQERKDAIFQRIQFGSKPAPNECTLWGGTKTKKGYGTISVTVDYKAFQLRVHRLVYFLCNNCKPLPPEMEVSHLCHQKLCTNFGHLSLEEGAVNCQRRTCLSEGRCFGHRKYKNCILPPEVILFIYANLVIIANLVILVMTNTFGRAISCTGW